MLGIHAAAIDFTLPSGIANSQAISNTAANAVSTFTLRKNTTSIGTITFSAGGTIGNITFTATQNFSVGDVLKVECPNPQDSALADIAITIKGSR